MTAVYITIAVVAIVLSLASMAPGLVGRRPGFALAFFAFGLAIAVCACSIAEAVIT